MDQSLVTGLTIFHVIVCILLTVTVLVQFGKGAEAGAMMGGGSSQAIFTTNSKGNFFTKLTTALGRMVLKLIKKRETKNLKLFLPILTCLRSVGRN